MGPLANKDQYLTERRGLAVSEDHIYNIFNIYVAQLVQVLNVIAVVLDS